MGEFRVGQLFHPSRTSWPETVQYNYRGGGHELVLFLPSPSPAEIKVVRKATCKAHLIVDGPVLLLGYEIGDRIDGTAPYSWHRVAEHERTIPPHGTGEQRALLLIFLVDATSGIVDATSGILRAMRQVTMPPALTSALHTAIADQAARAWDADAYDRRLERLYQESDHTLFRRAIASGILGS